MKYKRILPEIIVGLGDNTVFDDPQNPRKRAIKLHINLEGWLGDDLLWDFPEVIVTEKLKIGLENSGFSGFEFDFVQITKDVYFEDNYHLNKPLPKFYWMKIVGIEKENDFFIKEGELYVSEKALQYIRENFTIENLEIEPKPTVFDDFIKGLVEKDNRKANEN